MKTTKVDSKLKHRYEHIGSILWIISIQYFIVQFIVARQTLVRFSLIHNTISDLGNTVCGKYRNNIVCSPFHTWMNASFILQGILMIVGSILIYSGLQKRTARTIGFGFMELAGFGSALVGVFPENTISQFHILGASLVFILGNLALIILGLTLKLSSTMRKYTIGSGIVALIALILFFTHTYLGLGIGGTERITAYPQTIWLIVYGLYALRNPKTTKDQ